MRPVLILFLLISPLACTPGIPANPPAKATSTNLFSTPTNLQPTREAPLDTAPAAAPSLTSTETSDAILSNTSMVIPAEADAQVSQAEPGANYGNSPHLRADGTANAEFESFLRFTIPQGSEPILSARLRLYVTDNGTQDGPAVYAAEGAWDESNVTWENRPARMGNMLDNKSNLEENRWVEYEVTSRVNGPGTLSFVLVADSSDGVSFSSREGNQPPQLVLNPALEAAFTTVPTMIGTTSADAPVLVGAGDISECDNDNDELTAQLLDAIPGTVFTTGDNAYSNGTIREYNNCYAPTWGRHKERTKPVPGNHEYNTAGAAGYFEYFNNIPEYYAYDLGSWRLYALNSEINVSENSPQMMWLQADLAVNPRQCVLAYWHQPRWSSGRIHRSDDDLQALWEVLYEAGAEVVINGHEHNYERFAEMNAQGVAVSPGLREFVVGTGGGGLYDFGDPLPASEVRQDSTYGVLKLTLHPDRYDWEFVPVAGSTFTDSGSTSCH